MPLDLPGFTQNRQSVRAFKALFSGGGEKGPALSPVVPPPHMVGLNPGGMLRQLAAEF